MKFYEFGEKTAPVILLLPGTCCHWKLNFGEAIPLLEQHFHVVCVSYDGFDETEDGDQIEKTLQKAGFTDIQIHKNGKGWICVIAAVDR